MATYVVWRIVTVEANDALTAAENAEEILYYSRWFGEYHVMDEDLKEMLVNIDEGLVTHA